MPSLFFVVCRGDVGEDSEYYLATRLFWRNRQQAQNYANAISPSRQPLVIEASRGLDFREAEESIERGKLNVHHEV